MNFQGREIFKGFPIDRLSRSTLVLDNSLFSQTFGNDKMRSHECLIFALKHSQSNVFFFALLVIYGTLTKRVERVI